MKSFEPHMHFYSGIGKHKVLSYSRISVVSLEYFWTPSVPDPILPPIGSARSQINYTLEEFGLILPEGSREGYWQAISGFLPRCG